MSIIHEALKKVEASQANGLKAQVNNPSKTSRKIYLFYALMVCAGLFLANLLYGYLFPEPSWEAINLAAKGRAPTASIAPRAQDPSAASSVSAPSSKAIPSPFFLNGVFFSGDEGYALINDRIVKKDDKIEGATVVQITLEEVSLEFNGSIIKLSNSAK